MPSAGLADVMEELGFWGLVPSLGLADMVEELGFWGLVPFSGLVDMMEEMGSGEMSRGCYKGGVRRGHRPV